MSAQGLAMQVELAGAVGLAAAGEHAPESKSLVASAGDHHVAIRGHGHVEHAGGVADQHCGLLEGGVPPADDLVVAVPVRAD